MFIIVEFYRMLIFYVCVFRVWIIDKPQLIVSAIVFNSTIIYEACFQNTIDFIILY